MDTITHSITQAGQSDRTDTRHPAQRVTFMKAAQVGATETGNNWIGFVIHHALGPMLASLAKK